MKNIIEKIIEDRRPFLVGDDVIVPTDCLYFDGGSVSVRVHVSPHQEYILVDDAGNGIDRVIAAGKFLPKGKKNRFKSVSSEYGVVVSETGSISLNLTSVDDISTAVSIVANASVAVAERALSASLPRIVRNIGNEISDMLYKWFPDVDVKRNFHIEGGSHRKYTFDISALSENFSGRHLLISELTPKKVNTLFAANSDISRLGNKNITTCAVYDDQDEVHISRADLSFLASSGPVYAFSELSQKALLLR